MSNDLLLRKLQRQLKTEEFIRAAGRDPKLRLAAARLRGRDAIKACAADPGVPAGDRELAEWAGGDLRGGLLALRRRPGCAELAEGWLLLLKGEARRALARFADGQLAQPRRTTVGSVVALTCLGRLEEASKQWATVGPIPGAVFPASGALTRQLVRHEAGWDPAGLRRLVAAGDISEVMTAIRACPVERISEHAWLALRLADLRWRCDPTDQRMPALWDTAWREPALRPDVLKRRYWYALARHQLLELLDRQPVDELAQLHQLLAETDRQAARRCVEELTRDVPNADLVAVINPWHDASKGLPRAGAPPEWVLVWLRQAESVHARVHRFAQRDRNDLSRYSNLALPPSKIAGWRPWLRQLDQVYASEPVYLETKLRLLRTFRLHADLRLAVFQMLLAQPDRVEEFLPDWIRSAEADRRTRKAVGAELGQLHRAFPGRIDLAEVQLRLESGGPDLVQTLASTMPPGRAAVFRWRNLKGEPPALTAFGEDDDADWHLLRHAVHGARAIDLVRTLIRTSPARIHQLAIRLHQTRDFSLLHDLGVWWCALSPDDWRGWYHCGKADAGNRYRDSARSRLGRALELIDPAAREHAELVSWFEQLDDLESAEDSYSHELVDDGGDDEDVEMADREPRRPAMPTPPPRSAQAGLRAAARSCGMEGLLILAGLDAVANLLDGGTPPESLSSDQRQVLNHFLISMKPFLFSPHREWTLALLARLAEL